MTFYEFDKYIAINSSSYQNREGWAPAMYLKEADSYQVEAIYSASIKRKEATSKGSVQSTAKFSGKASSSDLLFWSEIRLILLWMNQIHLNLS